MTGPKTRTRRTLQRLCAGLLAGTVVVLVASWSAFQGVHRTAQTVQTRTAPSILEVDQARAALVAADAAAINSFHTGEVRLAGPGVQYQNQIAAASRSLAQVAEDNVAGSAGSQRIQLVEGLLVAYVGLIEQADALYRQDGGTELGKAHLWYASRLLHGGLLSQLDTLRQDEQRALSRQLSSGWLKPLAVSVWIGAILALLVLLLAAQIFLSLRFRRTLNPPLIGATVLLLVFTAGPSYSLVARHRLVAARHTLSQVGQDWRAQMEQTDRRGQRTLATLVTSACLPTTGGCGDTVSRFLVDLSDPQTGSGATDGQQPTARIRKVNEQTVAAADTGSFDVLMSSAALAVAALILLGLWPRINEYRYQT